ncbi:uncharacterized protein LOC133796056 [Humulus lupulus]|uniref:uncharacterized protein LOC133796056 n=1 Tax=Humulus lupulus TaxID=3486 RepID=UPI002B4165BE|nr:uncharacterized protein LOC133796056 [Humulus lupulus]
MTLKLMLQHLLLTLVIQMAGMPIPELQIMLLLVWKTWIPQLHTMGLELLQLAMFYKTCCFVKDKQMGTVLLKGKTKGGLYLLGDVVDDKGPTLQCNLATINSFVSGSCTFTTVDKVTSNYCIDLQSNNKELDTSFSRYTWIFPLMLKTQAIDVIIKFKGLVEKPFGLPIKGVQADWGVNIGLLLVS